jgi:hypothetical protein
MMRKMISMLALTVVLLALGTRTSVYATNRADHENSGVAVETGEFHGKVHKTSGRATIYQAKDGKLVLSLTHFATSNGPNLHVVLIAAADADDDANFLKTNTERVDLGALKGNQGDQNYEVPAGTDLGKFKTVSIFCERFNANFGAAPLQKF